MTSQPPASSSQPLSDPESALLRAIHLLDRAHDGGFKTKAFTRALDVVRATGRDELTALADADRLVELDGIGPSTAAVIGQALLGAEATYLNKLEAETRVPLSEAGVPYRAALRGDCHLHSRWSDGGAEIGAMAATAIELGHDYMVLTDHSARLTIAHGLDEERLVRQLDEVAALNRDLIDRDVDFRILTGMEVDILEDGSLDMSDRMLERLDVVVASVHSKLRMDSEAMTRRMLLAVANPHVDILGHCTGRLIERRPPSTFDADYVFAACATYNTAVEINCRPERLDPPRELIDVAIQHGCWFAIDSDAHATGQLEWQPYGCDRAAERGVAIDRIVNTMSADDLVAWTGTRS